MVHKKYSFKNGKSYGPYFYENKRVGEKIVTTYLGRESPKKFNFGFVAVAIVALLIALAFFLFYQSSPTGKAVLDVSGTYSLGEKLDGTLKLSLKAGELLPVDSIVRIKNGQQTVEIPLRNLISRATEQGNFYAENSELSGSGEGYGLAGKIISYPIVNFKLAIYDISDSINTNEGSTDNSSEIVSETPTDNQTDTTIDTVPETPTETPSETPSDTATESATETPSESTAGSSSEQSSAPGNSENSGGQQNTPSDESSSGNSGNTPASDNSNSESQSSPITGAVISENQEIIDGSVSKEDLFEYSLSSGKEADIVQGSVKLENGTQLDDSVIELTRDGSQISVSTDYSFEEKGYGQNYLGNEVTTLEVDLSDFNISVQDSALEIELVYDNQNIVSVQKDLNIDSSLGNESAINETTVNQTQIVPETNVSLNETNLTEINQTIFNISLLQKIAEIPTIRIVKDGSSEVDLSLYFSGAQSYSINLSNITSEFNGDLLTLTPQQNFSGAVRGNVTAYLGNESVSSNFLVLISSGAVNVQTLRGRVVVGEPVQWIKNVTLTEATNVSLEIPGEAENISITKIVEMEEKPAQAQVFGITGNVINGRVVAEVDFKKNGFFTWLRKIFSRITGNVVSEQTNITVDPITVILSDNATQYIVEYYTPAPEINEVNIENGKQVTISASDSLGYTDVIASTQLPSSLTLDEISRLKVLWYNYDSNKTIDTKFASEVENISLVDEILTDTNVTLEVVSEQVPLAKYVLQEMPFDYYDLDANGDYDYIEWVVPHLSNQRFDIVLTGGVNASYTNITTFGNYSRLTFDRSQGPYPNLTVYIPFDFYINSTHTYDLSGDNRDADMRGANVRLTSEGLYGGAYYS
ncbi:MAG TPA: hypothetical protein VHA12_03230, partial [Candidatus Nanoarchaeia archaeon]|nr:hypothetical protein [Candidatus Nanoarchaeia archaeon]